MYSYKEPRKKRLFDKVTKLWFMFVVSIFLIVLSYWVFLNSRSSSFGSELENIIKSNRVLSNSVNDLEKEFKILKMQRVLVQEVTNSNKLLNNSIKNLFNLVPDQITLIKVDMEKDTLTLDGLSSTKDAYRLLLEPPLKSIFNESRVNFKFDSSIGKYMFRSINSMTKKDKGTLNGKKK